MPDYTIPMKAPLAAGHPGGTPMPNINPGQVQPMQLDMGSIAKTAAGFAGAIEAGDQLRQLREAKQDRMTLEQYHKSGGEGNFVTSAGIEKTLTDLKGRLSENAYTKFSELLGQRKVAEMQLREQLSKADSAALTRVADQLEFTAQRLNQPMIDAYEQTFQETGSEDRARAAFENAKVGSIELAQGLKGPDDKPLIPPESIDRMRGATYQQVKQLNAQTNFIHARSQEELGNRAKEAETLKNLAEAGKAPAEVEKFRAEAEAKRAQARLFGSTAEGGGKGTSGNKLMVDPASDKRYIVNEKLARAWKVGDDGELEPTALSEIPKGAQPFGAKAVAPKTPAAFTQAQIVSMARATEDLDDLEKALFKHDKSGKLVKGKNGEPQFNTGYPFNINVPGTGHLPFNTESENAYSRLKSAIALRSEMEYGVRGAGTEATQKQMDRRYWVGATDTPGGAYDKIQRLKKGFKLGQRFAAGETSAAEELKRSDPGFKGFQGGTDPIEEILKKHGVMGGGE